MKTFLIPILIICSLFVFVSCATPSPLLECHEELLPAEAISWDEAKYRIGEEVTVYGPVVGTKYARSTRGTPTYLNIGKKYPAPDSFRVVIWGDCRLNFPKVPEVYYLNKCIYITGIIVDYEGVPEIEICYPYQIQRY